MLCQDLARCAELSYCQAPDAVLNIGQLVDAPYPGTARVMFTDLATGRVTIIDNAGSGVDISIDTEDFTPLQGHAYEVEVVIGQESGAIIPIAFIPYVLTGNDVTAGTTSYMLATARFVKVFTVADAVDQVNEQWLILKP